MSMSMSMSMSRNMSMNMSDEIELDSLNIWSFLSLLLLLFFFFFFFRWVEKNIAFYYSTYAHFYLVALTSAEMITILVGPWDLGLSLIHYLGYGHEFIFIFEALVYFLYVSYFLFLISYPFFLFFRDL